jgi:hypothetical protein
MPDPETSKSTPDLIGNTQKSRKKAVLSHITNAFRRQRIDLQD